MKFNCVAFGLTFSLGIGLVGLISGCGPAGGTVSVRGHVTFDDESISEGTIAFVPSGATSGSSTGGPIQNGTYSLGKDAGLVPGTYTVEIRASRKTGEIVPAVPPATGEVEVSEQFIPAKYNSESTLEAQVQSGENELDFNLRSTES